MESEPTLPHRPEDTLITMKREVLEKWDQQSIDVFGRILEIEDELKRLRYELEIARRLLGKADDDAARETWRTQVDVLDMLVGQAEGELEEQQQEMAVCDAMVAEIKIDLGLDPTDYMAVIDDGELPF